MAEHKITLSADASKHNSEMDKAGKSVKSYGDKWKDLKNIAVGNMLADMAAKAAMAVVDAGKSAYDFANELKDLSDQTGLSTTDLQTLIYAGEELGMTIGDITGMIFKMNTQFAELRSAEPSKDLIANLKQLGFTIDELNSITDEGMFIEAFTKKMADATEGSKEMSAAIGILGKTGTRMKNLLGYVGKKGFAGTSELFSDQILTAGQVNRAERLDTEKNRKKRQGRALLGNVFGAGTTEETAAEKKALAEKRANAKKADIVDLAEAEKKAKIIKVEKEAAKDINDLQNKDLGGGGGTVADRLASIGGGMGASLMGAKTADRQVQLAAETLKVQEKMAQDIEEIRKEGGGLE